MILNICLQELTQHLHHVSHTPRLDAELLLMHALEKPRHFLYAYPEFIITDRHYQTLQESINRRLEGEPIAYIVGHKEFWSLPLRVTHDTLIPRPDTESLVEWALTHLPDTPCHIADIGTGSGAIALALAHERPHWEIHATDSSMAALQVAIQNAAHHTLTNTRFFWGSWYEALPIQKYAAIISNPPYIDIEDPHLEALTHEPQQALIADDNGLAAFKTLIADASTYLQPGGVIILEHGYNQADAVIAFLQSAGFTEINSHCDLGKQHRFVVGRLT